MVASACRAAPATRQVLSVRIQKAHAQRLRHARAAVVGGAAPQPQNKAAAPAIKRVQNELPKAKCRGDTWIAHRPWHKVQPGGGSHLDHGGSAIAQHAVARPHRRAHRACHIMKAELPRRCVYQRIHCAFTAIGNRQADTIERGKKPSETPPRSLPPRQMTTDFP
jgi:hypothetical protein